MNWNRISGNWDHFKPLVRSRWNRLDEGELRLIAGKREKLLASIRDLYGLSETEGEAQLAAWQESQDWKPPVQ